MKLIFLKNKWLLSGLLSISLLLGGGHVGQAQISQSDTNEFHRIEQPLGLKVGVTAAGLGLIGLELWWFLFSKNKAQRTKAADGVQSIDIAK